MKYIFHACGQLFKHTQNIFKKNLDIKFTKYDDLTILSIMNESCFKDSYLVKQCSNNNVPLCVPHETFNVTKNEWTNLLKISSIVNALKNINTEYVLILDGKDTSILKDLDEKFINDFKALNADIIYNSQLICYPEIKLESETFLKENKNKYINAGVCIGYKDKLLQFYTECLDNINDIVIGYDGKPSEQYVIRKTANNTKLKVRCDYNEKLFTCYVGSISH